MLNLAPCAFVSVSRTFVEAKMCKFTLESTHIIFNKCPIYTHDIASAKFCTNSSLKAQISSFKYQEHRINIELDLQSLGSMSRDMHSCSHWLRPRKARNLPSPPPSPAFGLIYEGRYWSAKIDISLHRVNMEVDFQSLFLSRDLHSCSHWLRPRTPPPPPYTRGAVGQLR